jgi:hypothetical protein
MDPVQSYLSYVAAALPAPLIARPPLTIAVDLVGVALALVNVRARRFAPAGARRLAWLAVVAAGLAPLLVSLGPWVSTLGFTSATIWSTAALAALLLAVLLLGAASGRLIRSGVARPVAALVELAGLLVVTAGLIGVSLPTLAAIGWLNPATLGALPQPSDGVAWSVALAGALIVLAANAAGGVASLVPAGRRVGMILTALAYVVVVTGVTFVPDWIAGAGTWETFAVAIHATDALALLALASAARHMLNRPSAAEYWVGAGRPSTAVERTRRRAVIAPKPAHIVPAVKSDKQSALTPTLTTMARPVVPPSALAPFAPPALRRTVIYGPDVSATVQTVAPTVANELAPAAPLKAPLVAPDALSVAAPTEANTLPSGAHAAAMSENRAPEQALSPQFVEAVLMLQTEMLRAGRHYSFAELVEVFSEVAPRAGASGASARAFGRAGLLDWPHVDMATLLPADKQD